MTLVQILDEDVCVSLAKGIIGDFGGKEDI